MVRAPPQGEGDLQPENYIKMCRTLKWLIKELLYDNRYKSMGQPLFDTVEVLYSRESPDEPRT